jgi:HTH-type transcriptional regulator, sugar sensing transcriptional regulator
MSDTTQLLQELGFSEYEIKAYVALLKEHPLNGYSIAKSSGVPRANVYAVLQKLEERGAIYSLETEVGTAYSPVPPRDLIQRLSHHINIVLEKAEHALYEVATPVEQQYVQNIHGYEALIEHAQELMNNAEHRLLVAFWQSEAEKFAEQLADVEARDVQIDILCFQACPEECSACRGQLYRYRVTPEQDSRWLIVIRDDVEMVMGITQGNSVSIRTCQSSLVSMSAWYVRHSIALAAILMDMGERLEIMLRPETQSLLASIGQGQSWLQHMLHLVQNK